MESFFENAANIITSAATNSLGLAALVLILSALIAFFWFQKSKEWIRLSIFLVLFIGGLLFAYAGHGASRPQTTAVTPVVNLDSEYKACTKDFTDPSQANEIINSCNTFLEENSEDIEALLARAQARAVNKKYDLASEDFEKVFNLVPGVNKKEAKDLNSQERRVAVLRAFWPEHLSLVRDQSGVCRRASLTYEFPIAAYRSLFGKSPEETDIEKKELFGILELGHFSSDRDGDWALALELYELILKDIDSDSINALLSKAHAHLMSGTNPISAEPYLNRVEALYPSQKEIQAKIAYHRGSILARQQNYEEAESAYGQIIENEKYKSVLREYPFLKFIVQRDRAFSLYALNKFEKATQAFDDASETLSEINDIEEREKDNRLEQISTFRRKSSSCNLSDDSCGSNDSQLNNYINYGYIFSHLISHETEKEENAFFEEGHAKFYGCLEE